MVDSLTGNRGGIVLILIVVLLLVSVLATIVFVIRLLTTFKPVHAELAPFGAKAAFWGALAYTLLPIDLLADPILLDDLAVLASAVVYISRVLSDSNGPDETDDGRPEILG